MLKKMFLLVLTALIFLVTAPGCNNKSVVGGQKTEGVGAQTVESTTNTTKEAPDYGDTGGLKLPVADKPSTVTWLIYSPVPDINDKPVIEELRKRTGIDLQVQAVIDFKAYGDKVNVLLASNQLPDIFYGLPLSQVNDLGAKGVLTPINRFADNLPNFRSLYMDRNSITIKPYTDEKGDLYTWPLYGVARDVNHGFLYRKDIFDKNGIKEWTNTDQFYEALKKLKTLYPQSIPYASKTKEQIFQDWAYSWGVGTSSTNWPCYYDESAGLWKFVGNSSGYRDMINFMRKLYTEGLLDPEFLTDTLTSWTSKMTEQEKSFVTFDWIGRMDMFADQVKEKIPEYDLRYANPIGPVGKIRHLSKVDTDFGIVIANHKNKEAALKLMDYMISPSGSELMTIGIKEVEFTYDANNKPVYPELKNKPKVDINTLLEKYGCWAESLYLKADPRSIYFNYTEREQEAQDKMVKGNKIEISDPIIKFTKAENTTLADIRTTLKEELDAFSTRYILSKTVSEKDWFDWEAKADKLGARTMAEIYNKAQTRFTSQD